MIFSLGQRIFERAYSSTLEDTQTCLKNIGLIIVNCHQQRVICTYICTSTYIRSYISTLLVRRVLYNSDVVGFLVSDLVISEALCM
jgi:hypothetical protein